MPSYTFVSTANAFVLRGAIPVFVDIRPDTLNIDEKLIELAIHKNGRDSCRPLCRGCLRHGYDSGDRFPAQSVLIEDSAQGMSGGVWGRSLGSMMFISQFHETKNVISGEGGALLVNNRAFLDRAEIIREKGTNRSQFFRGQVDKYTWVDIGSSFLPSELIAAFLLAQFEEEQTITENRLLIWNRYHASLEQLEKEGVLRRPRIPG